MAQTINFGLVNLEANQYNPENTYNQNLQVLDVTVQICADSITNTPPTAQDGKIVIVGSAGTGAFSGNNNKIAYYYSGWKFITPKMGWIATISSTLSLVMWDGTTWSTPGTAQNYSSSTFYIYNLTDTTTRAYFDLTNVTVGDDITISVYDNVILAKQNLTALTSPTSSDDDYNISSLWIDNVTNKAYICVNNTPGSALWKEIASATGAGDVLGPITSIDNELAKFNGVSGNYIQGSGVIISDNRELYNNYTKIDTIVSNYTIKATDSGKVIVVNSSGTINITLPQTSNELINAGFNCTVLRRGTGAVVFLVEGSDILESRNNGVSIATRYSTANILKLSSGSPNTWGLYGDII